MAENDIEALAVEQRDRDAAAMLADAWYEHGRPALTRDTTWVAAAFAAHRLTALRRATAEPEPAPAVAADGELLPCPFCGGDAAVTTYETESLWSHNQVTYTKVGCCECDVYFNSEPGFEPEAPQAWNYRHPTDSAAKDAEIARLQSCLDSRDVFIVERGLWGDYTDTLPKTRAALANRGEAGALAKERAE